MTSQSGRGDAPAPSAWGAPLPVPRSALVVAAHPDDAEFGAGATLARWAELGTTIHHLVCTDGSKGTWDPTADLEALVGRRRDEQRAAARALGACGEVVFLGVVDGELDATDRSVRSEVARVIRSFTPQVVLGHDPWKRYRLHPDHRHAGMLTVEGIVAARDPHFFPEHGLAPHRPDALLLFEADAVNHVEPVERRHLGARVAALEAHRSQWETTHHYRVRAATPDGVHDGFVQRETDKLRDMGALGGVEFGEAFHLMDQL